MTLSVARVMLLGLLTSVLPAGAEDVTTLSGTTYHQVGVVRVEPDGVIWEHATGVVKVDFTDLPEPVRRAYHYDAAKATAFQAAQAKIREQAATRVQQVQRDAEELRTHRFQAQTAPNPASPGGRPGQFVYRHKAADAALVESAGEGIVAKKQEEFLRTKDDGTIYDRRLWAIPRLITGGYSDGTGFDLKTDLNSREYQSNLHSAEGVKEGDYMTRSYYKDVDRATAFARGSP